ncbi:hypothetical protein AX16_006742 [Volvariella volvacea WC 439]|nr:hypothetical protein AX16_006742 [Volvariella volvacea WC 439]
MPANANHGFQRMSRNNVRGPTSALTEFLRESGITHLTVAQRAATRNAQASGSNSNGQNTSRAASTNADQQENRENEEAEASTSRPRRGRGRAQAPGYASDELDEPAQETSQTNKKRKMSKAAEAKAKAKAKADAKKKAKGKGGDDDDYSDDNDEDEYTALSKNPWKNVGGPAKPSVGSFEDCAVCKKQFTVTRYTLAANPGPGFLCHQCAKASGADPFKKPAAPRKRKAPADKRNVVSFEERRFPTLVSMCIDVIAKHIGDVEALGDIGQVNMEAISKTLSKNRSLTPENATLFYDATNTSLTFHDATSLPSSALCSLAYLNPNLTSLRLDFCGQIDDAAISTFSSSLPGLVRIELLGPFLVRAPAWQNFFASHPMLEGFLITQSPRFDLDCVKALVQHCGPTLTELRLREVGKMDDAFIAELTTLGSVSGTTDKKGKGKGKQKAKQGEPILRYLDLGEPGASCSEPALVGLMQSLGPSLTSLDLSRHNALTDDFLFDGVLPNVTQLTSLSLCNVPDLTDQGVARFFDQWIGKNTGLIEIRLSRNHLLGSQALKGILKHSGRMLEVLEIDGWKDVGEDVLRLVAKYAKELREVDVGWCRAMDDFVVKAWLYGEDDGNTASVQEKPQARVKDPEDEDAMDVDADAGENKEEPYRVVMDERVEEDGKKGGCEKLKHLKVWGCNRVTANCPRRRGLNIYGVESHTAIPLNA